VAAAPWGRPKLQAASRQSDIQPMFSRGDRKSLSRKRIPAEWRSSEFCG
jgi:hypothetical protein